MMKAVYIWYMFKKQREVMGSSFAFAALFCIFTLVIMHTKINYMEQDCYELDPLYLLSGTMCHARDVTVSFSFLPEE